MNPIEVVLNDVDEFITDILKRYPEYDDHMLTIHYNKNINNEDNTIKHIIELTILSTKENN